MKKLLSISFMSLVTGCASVPDVTIESKAGYVTIPSGEEVCIIFPDNGELDGKVHQNSGGKVGEIISKSIPKDFKVKKVSSPKECTANFLLTSNILEYENRASGWSGLPDKIRVKVNLKNTTDGSFSTFTYYADSNMAASAFFEWGNAAPYALLGDEFETQVSDLLHGR